MEERYFIQVGNCFVKFLDCSRYKMVSDISQATPFYMKEKALKKANSISAMGIKPRIKTMEC